MTTTSFDSRRARWLFVLAAAATIAVYWPGLHGPFLFDDRSNFDALQRWLTGQTSWREAVFGQQSLLISRPVAMLSFMLNAAINGDNVFGFKLGNLIVHLLCGFCVWQVVHRAISLDTRLSSSAELLAGSAAALWLLHPLHASTVLYAVQRMAQLSALFTLAAIWTYLVARQQLIIGRTRAAAVRLFLLFPFLLVAGFLSKQNAVVAPALCLVMELAYFRTRSPPQRLLQLFFTVTLWLPLGAGLALLLFAPQRLLADYALYDFTLGQRLLTEPRILLDYLGQLLLPRGPQMGLYTDDFVASSGLLSPSSTLFAIIALTAISSAAIALRRRAPSFFAGWWFFLIAHGVESTFLPLDLYFEHRNYLPAVGLLLAAAGLLALAPARIATNVFTPRRLGILAVVGLGIVFAFGTLGRSLVWQDKYTIAEQGLKQHPQSLRAALDLASAAFDRGDNATHDSILTNLIQHPDARARRMGRIYQIAVSCLRHHNADPSLLDATVTDSSPQVTLADLHAFTVLANIVHKNDCGGVTTTRVADAIVILLESTSTQPDSAQPKWLLRFTAANLYLRASQFPQAQAQAELAWQKNADPPIGAVLAQAYARNGQFADAERALEEAISRTSPYATVQRAGMEKVRLWMNALPRQ